jgi:cell division protein FtsZ
LRAHFIICHYINYLADVNAVMNNVGMALMGIGAGSGKPRSEDAAAAEISSPLLYATIDCATGVMFSMSGG